MTRTDMDSEGKVLQLRSPPSFIRAPFKMISNLSKNRSLLKNLIARDFKVNYHGHILGFFWSIISNNLTSRKEECQRAFDVVKNNLARARYDIKELHDSKVHKTKQISNWEVKYLKEHGMVDIVSHRKDLRETLYKVLQHISQ